MGSSCIQMEKEGGEERGGEVFFIVVVVIANFKKTEKKKKAKQKVGSNRQPHNIQKNFWTMQVLLN